MVADCAGVRKTRAHVIGKSNSGFCHLKSIEKKQKKKTVKKNSRRVLQTYVVVSRRFCFFYALVHLYNFCFVTPDQFPRQSSAAPRMPVFATYPVFVGILRPLARDGDDIFTTGARCCIKHQSKPREFYCLRECVQCTV